MQEIINSGTEPLYFIAHDNNSICHYGKMMTINCMGTNQPNLEQFSVKQEWLDRASVLGEEIDGDLFN